MSEPVYVIAIVKAKPGKEAAAEMMLKTLVEATHKVGGCVVYALHKRLDQPGAFYFVEKWKSQADLDQQLKSAHLKAAFSRQEELLSLVDVGVVTPILAGDPQKGLVFKSS